MKKVLPLLSLLVLAFFGIKAQTTLVFTENFELPSLADSVTSTQQGVAGVDDWGISTKLHSQGLRSDTCQVKTGKTCYLTTNTFSTLGNTYIIFQFAQICKTDFGDKAKLEVSSDGGTTWTLVPAMSGTTPIYLGSGAFSTNGNSFSSNSYGAVWQPANATAIPANSWWRTEQFDFSIYLANTANAKIRFHLQDLGSSGNAGNYGWCIDDMKVIAAPCELIPPTITLASPILSGQLYSLGPFPIKAYVHDISGIDTAYIKYTINGGPLQSVGMHHIAADTMLGTIPTTVDSTTICWYIQADDNSPCHNNTINPTTGCISVLTLAGITFPFVDNFDVFNVWTPTTTAGSSWQLGSPTTTSCCTGPYSAPNCWDIDLTAQYQNNSTCYLTSPAFDFSQAVNARLSFYLKYQTEANLDGCRMEYTINGGATWLSLGVYNDPLGTNWFNSSSITSTGKPGWTSLTGGSCVGWQLCKYKLSVLNNVVGNVQFRYVFTSDVSAVYDGFSLDDFSITLPAAHEAATTRIIAPASGCGLGSQNVVKIKIANTGLTQMNAGTGGTASYRVKNGTTGLWSSITTEPITNLTIAAGDSATFTFAGLADLTTTTANINYTIKAWVSLPGDPNHADDTTTKVINSKFVPPPPTVTNPSILYGANTTLTATTGVGNTVTWYAFSCTGTQLGTGTSYLTPFLYALTVYYTQATNTANGCKSACQPDTVHVGAPPPFDGATVKLVTPVSGIDLTSSEVVKIKLINYGTQAMSNFQVGYTKGTGPTLETFTGTIAPGDSAFYTFTTHADLSLYQTYHMKAWCTVTGDINHVNDTVYKDVINSMIVYCVSAATSTGDDDIGNVTVSNINNGIATPTTNNPTSNNLYTNFTQTVSPIIFVKGQTYPCSISQIDLSGTFYTCYLKVFVDWNYDGVFDEPTETVMSVQGTGVAGTPYLGNITVPLTAHVGYTRLRAVLVETGSAGTVHPCGTYTWGETEDYTCLVIPQSAKDAGVTAATVPPLTYPQNWNASPAITLKNFGSDTIFPGAASNLSYSYKLDNGPTITSSYAVPYTKIAPGGTQNVTFAPISWPGGTHLFKAWTTMTGDTVRFDDTLKRTIYGVPVDTIPYYDGFDGATQKFTAVAGGGTNWINGVPLGSNWPTTAVSPPNVWATNLNISGGYTNSANCTLTTQIFDFTNAVNAKLSFWYKYTTENGLDGTTLKYSTDGGTTWQNLGVVNSPLATPAGSWFNGTISTQNPDPGWTGAGPTTWKQTTYKLNAFNGVPTMRFKWTFSSDGSITNNGMAIDDFKITIPYHKDAGVDSILYPKAAVAAGVPCSPRLRIKNFGMDTLYSVSGSYVIDNGPPIAWNWGGGPGQYLKPDDTVSFIVATGFNVPQGSYLMTAYSSLANDGDHHNDTCKSQLFGIAVFTVPYFDNFDTLHELWYRTGTQWQHGTPAATNTVINSPYSPPFCWKTILNGNYSKTGVVEYLYSPLIDFSGAGWDSLKFYHWVHIYQNDGGKIEYHAMDGSWKLLGGMSDPNAINWYNTSSNGFSSSGGLAGWHQSAYDLKVLADFALPTQFRFAFSAFFVNTTWNGWAVDDFELTTPKIAQDAGVIAITQPTGTTTYGAGMQVVCTIKNFGTDTLTYIPVKFRINNITVGSGVFTGILLPDSTTTFTFPGMPSPQDDYELCAYTDIATDSHYNNDTTCAWILVVPPQFDLELTDILAPVTQTIHGTSSTVTVKVTNKGQDAVQDIPLTYTVGGNMVVVNETWNRPTPLLHGETDSYTFTQSFTYEFLGWYWLCAHVDYPNDGYRENDTICNKIEEAYTGISVVDPSGLTLWQNNPNPSDRSTEIVYRLPKPGRVDFEVVNYLGQKIYSEETKASEGDHQIRLNTADMQSGIYYYYIRFDGKQLVRKMIVSH